MRSAVKRRREREGSCFSRAARRIRSALSRACRDDSPHTDYSLSFTEEGGSFHSQDANTLRCSDLTGVLETLGGEQRLRLPTRSHCIAPTDAAPPCPQVTPPVLQDSAVCTEGSRTQDACKLSSVMHESEPGDGDVLVEEPVTAVDYPVTDSMLVHYPSLCPPAGFRSMRDSSCLSRFPRMPSPSPIISAACVLDMLLESILKEFTPDEDDEAYRFQCSRPGLYLCRVTGLVFHMGGEGDVLYRIVPWNRKLLAQHHKKPAGPLFDIDCVQQAVCHLLLPHCELSCTAGRDFLSVAHVRDECMEFVSPVKVTETHVIINTTEFSGFGNVKDADSAADPVRALVLLFYRSPADLPSRLSVLLLPRNVVLSDVVRKRKELVEDESYLEIPAHPQLHPQQTYTLSTGPEVDPVVVQPTEEKFDSDNYDDYYPSFQVTWETPMKHIKLLLRDTTSSHCVWERLVYLPSPGVRVSQEPSALNLPPHKRLFHIRSGFIERISGPVLKSLLDKLFERAVLTESEREAADEEPNTRNKARSVIDIVRKKGEAASAQMIELLREADPFLCKHLEL